MINNGSKTRRKRWLAELFLFPKLPTRLEMEEPVPIIIGLVSTRYGLPARRPFLHSSKHRKETAPLILWHRFT
jgi:hypothetical protein